MRSRGTLLVGIAICAAIAAFTLLMVLDARQPVQIVIHSSTPDLIRVQISGAVATPGVYEIDGNARLDDLVVKAGGLQGNADLRVLNLAGRVGDGESVMVPTAAALVASPAAKLVNLNTATLEELDQLPGIGPTLAARIVEFRTVNGPFESVEELDEVEGISPATVEDLRPYITVEPYG